MEVWAVKNDNTKVRVQDDLVLGFRVSLERFNDEFKIGRCLCETARLTLAKEAALTDIYGFITLDPDEFFYIDSVDTTNEDYVVYQLADFIVKLNKPFEYEVPTTVDALLDKITNDFNLGYLVKPSDLVLNLPVSSCDPTASYRDFLGMVYEADGANLLATFGRPDKNFLTWPAVNLVILQPEYYDKDKDFEGGLLRVIDAEDASDITVGDTLNITKVQVNNGLSSVGTDDGYVYNCNSDNILITNSDQTDAVLQNIYDKLHNVSISNLKMSNYTVADSNLHHLGHTTFISVYWPNELTRVKAVNNIDWEYVQTEGAANWLDNFNKSLDFNIKTKNENDTSVSTDVNSKLRGIRTLIQQTAEEIKLLAESENDEHERIESLISQTAAEISLTVSELENGLLKQSTTFVVESDGAYIKQGREGYYSRFTDSGMEVYSNNQKIAEATADTFKAPSFTTDNWTIREEDNGTTLNFFRGNW